MSLLGVNVPRMARTVVLVSFLLHILPLFLSIACRRMNRELPPTDSETESDESETQDQDQEEVIRQQDALDPYPSSKVEQQIEQLKIG
jgi:hypothetical protein